MAPPAFPPPPTDAIDWSDIGFQVRPVNGHIETHFNVDVGSWSEPVFVGSPFLRIHGMAPGLNYGQQCYEGLKAFRLVPDGTEDGTKTDTIAIFRPARNAARMMHSAEVISIPPVPEELFRRCVRQAVASNAEFVPPHETGAALYVRPLLFGSSAQLGLSPPKEYTFCVFVIPTGVYHGTDPVDALILEQFDRAAPEGTGNAKVGGNYAPVLRWSQKAYKEGFGITLHLDSKTRTIIDEFSTSGFVGIRWDDKANVTASAGKVDPTKNKATLVVPDSHNVIDSVTSDSIFEIARSWGWTVEKRAIPYEELESFHEVVAVGTAAAVVPIRSITMNSRNDKIEYLAAGAGAGQAASLLLSTLKGIQLGKIEDTFGWLEPVSADERLAPVTEQE